MDTVMKLLPMTSLETGLKTVLSEESGQTTHGDELIEPWPKEDIKYALHCLIINQRQVSTAFFRLLCSHLKVLT
jgi:hypothetical protein